MEKWPKSMWLHEHAIVISPEIITENQTHIKVRFEVVIDDPQNGNPAQVKIVVFGDN